MSAATLRERANRTRALWLGVPPPPRIAECAERIADPDVRADFLAAFELAAALRKRANALHRAAWAEYQRATGITRRGPPV